MSSSSIEEMVAADKLPSTSKASMREFDDEQPSTSKASGGDGLLEGTNVDLFMLKRGVWLIKVPNYISDKWEKAPPNVNVGEITIRKQEGTKPDISMELSDDVLGIEPKNTIPSNYKLTAGDLSGQTLGDEQPSTSKASGGDGLLEGTNVDRFMLKRGVWLIKVPNYISDKWEKAPPNVNVGEITIRKQEGTKPDISMELSDDVLGIEPKNTIPSNYKLTAGDLSGQTLGIFSEEVEPKPSSSKGYDSGPSSSNTASKVSSEGYISQKMQCHPVMNNTYVNMKQSALANKEVGASKTKKISELVNNYLPKSDHQHNIEYRKRNKEIGKRYRSDKDVVQDKILKAFECKNAYTTEELLKMTNKPRSYLMEILKKICTKTVHNRIGAVWQLKRLYIHVTPMGTPKGKDEETEEDDMIDIIKISDDQDDEDWVDEDCDKVFVESD